jgi:ABC-type amino acid transport substrate-binding protein
MRLRWLLLTAALFAAACGGEKSPTVAGKPKESFAPGSFMAQLQQAGTLRVGVKFDVPQFGFLNPATNKPEGFDVDMAKAVADELGVKPEYSEAISTNRIPFLQGDKVDIVFSTMTINDERKQQIDFTDVYYVAGQTFLVKKGKPVTLETAAGKKVCTAKGSTSEKNLTQLAPKAEVVLQDGYAQCFQLLQTGQADAMTTDNVILAGFLKKDPSNFELSGGEFSQEPYGGGIKKGHTDFVDFVNKVIRAMKTDGRWAKLYDKWIGSVTGTQATPPPAEVAAKVGK